MADVNILAATHIYLRRQRQMVRDDQSVTHSAARVIDLGSDQAAKIVSLMFRNNGSSAYTITVAVSETNAGDISYIYEDYSLAANTTWWAIAPYTTGPIFLEENDELRAHGSTGANTYVWINCNYELLYEI